VPNGSPSLQVILNIVLGVVGALAFLLIVLAGLRYTLSQGDQPRLQRQKTALFTQAIGLL